MMTNRRSVFDEKDTKTALRTLQSNLDREEKEDYEDYEDDKDHEEAPPGYVPAREALPAPAPAASVASARDEEEEEEEESDENLTVDEILERARSYEDWDIFEDVAPSLILKGDTVKYSIKKNGKHVATVEHPYSYDEIQKNFGGGSYVVTLRSKLFSKRPGGGYLTSQPRVVATPEEAGRPAAPIVEKGTSLPDTLAMLQQMNDKARAEQKAEMERLREEDRLREERRDRERKEQEARDREREEKRASSENSTMMLMMKMMEQNAQASREAAQRSSDMLIAILTKTPPPAPVEKEDKRGDKMFDLMLNVLLDKKGKGEAIDPLKLQEIVSAAEEKGYSRAKEVRELANEEAERLAALGGRARDDDDDEEKEEKPESTTQTLLKTLTPLLTQLAQQPAQPQLPPPRQIPRQPMMQRPPMAPRPPAHVNVNPNQPAAVRAPAPAPKPGTEPGGHHVKEATAPNPPQRTPAPAGLPRAGAGLTRATPPQTAPAPAQKVNTMKPSKKEIASEIVINLMGQDLQANLLTQKFDPEATADKALASLKDHGIDAHWLSNNFTLAEMKAVARGKGMPDAFDPYLERFHSHVFGKWNQATPEKVPEVVTNPS